MRRSVVVVLSYAASLAACTSKTLEIQSNTSWSGAIGGISSRTVQGSGNASFAINTNDTFCWTMQKETEQGSLRAYAKVHTITGVDNESDETTTATFGIVSGCTR
jgi:hypothetical protein